MWVTNIASRELLTPYITNAMGALCLNQMNNQLKELSFAMVVHYKFQGPHATCPDQSFDLWMISVWLFDPWTLKAIHSPAAQIQTDCSSCTYEEVTNSHMLSDMDNVRCELQTNKS